MWDIVQFVTEAQVERQVRQDLEIVVEERAGGAGAQIVAVPADRSRGRVQLSQQEVGQRSGGNRTGEIERAAIVVKERLVEARAVVLVAELHNMFPFDPGEFRRILNLGHGKLHRLIGGAAERSVVRYVEQREPNQVRVMRGTRQADLGGHVDPSPDAVLVIVGPADAGVEFHQERGREQVRKNDTHQ